MIHWKEWNPGLDNGLLTLRAVCDTLPGVSAEDVSAVVRLFENPDSPIAFKGAVTLERHDCIHVLLGRGLLNQDEAFVLGFTMGTAKSVSSFQKSLFTCVAQYLYPEPYRFTESEVKVFELAFELGKSCRVTEIYDIPFEEKWDTPLWEVREWIGLNVERLRAVYQEEQALLPESVASQRLPV